MTAAADAEAEAAVDASPGWRARLQLDYRRSGDSTLAHDRHVGPLRVLQPLYPEGPGVCHHVIVHPPGGVVGGDELLIDATLGPGSHALVTTPGATRFYRSDGALARQHARLHLDADARLEWLPLETIAHAGCNALTRVTIVPAAGAEAIGWEVLALGLPASRQPFDSGVIEQHIALPGVWLERGRIAAADRALLDSPVGLAGHRVLATLWFVAGSAIAAARRDALLDAARSVIAGHALARTAGATAPQRQVLVLRALASGVEPALQLLMAVRAAWRSVAWDLPAAPPRIWRT